ncbi:hypothetical protein [Aureimonas altamirensis]|uniref:hypothetical protein n=1 Tax=Aureimonas altamirensis TaxID=370622 RepID=UPI003017F804
MRDGLYLYSTGPSDRRDAFGTAIVVGTRIYGQSEGQVFSGQLSRTPAGVIGFSKLVYELEVGPAESEYLIKFEGEIVDNGARLRCVPNDVAEEAYYADLVLVSTE